jgi:NAD(P)-dependent dehydrogenase (short-subunit alcohol dehydrogenase family)
VQGGYQGRQQSLVDVAVERLCKECASENVVGFACDVAEFDQLENLWEASVKRFGPVDIWINNAGISNTSKSTLGSSS